MHTLKTVNEIVRERMNKCVDTLTHKYMKSVRPIYGSTYKRKPEHIGSCVLIELESIKYLITAAHVIDHNEDTTLYVANTTHLIEIKSKAIVSKAYNNDRYKDKLDFAILPLSEEMIIKLNDVIFLSESDMLTFDNQNDKSMYLALGFPNTQNKKVDIFNRIVTQNPFVYSSLLNKEAYIFKKIGADQKFNLLLNFSSKQSKDENNNVVNSFSPVGTSGGGLFLIEGMNNPENYRPNSPCSGKLVGILIENHKRYHVILATKISVIKTAIKLHAI